MGNFAENLNLGKRALPPWFELEIDHIRNTHAQTFLAHV